jgi:hypothetical protein
VVLDGMHLAGKHWGKGCAAAAVFTMNYNSVWLTLGSVVLFWCCERVVPVWFRRRDTVWGWEKRQESAGRPTAIS